MLELSKLKRIPARQWLPLCYWGSVSSGLAVCGNNGWQLEFYQHCRMQADLRPKPKPYTQYILAAGGIALPIESLATVQQ